MKQRETTRSLKEAIENSLSPELSTFLKICKPAPVPISLVCGFLFKQPNIQHCATDPNQTVGLICGLMFLHKQQHIIYIPMLFKERICLWHFLLAQNIKNLEKATFKIEIQSEVMIVRDAGLLTFKRDTKKEVTVYLVSGKITKSWVLFVQLNDQRGACYCNRIKDCLLSLLVVTSPRMLS